MVKLENSKLFSSIEYNIIEKIAILTTPDNIRYKYSNITKKQYDAIITKQDPDSYIHYKLDAPEKISKGNPIIGVSGS